MSNRFLKLKSKIAEETAPLYLDNVDILTRQFMTLEKAVPTHLVVSPALERYGQEICNWLAVHRGKERNTAAPSFTLVVNDGFDPTEWALMVERI
jgi:hypothetical protein